MKKIFLFLTALSLSIFVYAQNVTLEDVCKGLSLKENTTGDFTQIKTINSNGRKLRSTGKYIICPEGIMWNTLKPFPSKLVITKTQMIQTGADGKQTVMSSSDNQIFENISSTLSSVFSGNSDELNKNFETKFNIADGKWNVELTPKDSTIASVMKLLILSGSMTAKTDVSMDKLEILETSSNTITYEFSNQEYPKELSLVE